MEMTIYLELWSTSLKAQIALVKETKRPVFAAHELLYRRHLCLLCCFVPHVSHYHSRVLVPTHTFSGS